MAETRQGGDPHGYCFEDLEVGMAAEYTREVTQAGIGAFAELSGDVNPLHLDDDFARTTMFKGCIAHGILIASYISTVIGTKLPGPGCIYVTQELKFRAPVRPGDRVTARVTVAELIPEKRRVRLETICAVGERVVIDGEALVIVPSRA
jgi:3-hydroxybutyryl-CoA dehydratase